MKTLAVLLALLPLLTTSCLSNHQFADHGDRLPDAQGLELARQALPPEETDAALLDMTWIPLISLQVDHYGASEELMLPGNTLSEIEAYGPLVMVGRHDEWLFDEKGELYEEREQSFVLWGLWCSKSTKVRVPTGWRVESKPSLLWGLFSWPTTVYTLPS